MARHAWVTFLEDQESLKGVDTNFRKLVEALHWIPFCASFGVSCSGHFYETDENSEWSPNSFHPIPYGQLNVIILPTAPHIKELLQLMERMVANYADTTFKKIQHIFGPPETSKVEVWEIRIRDNGCLGQFEQEASYGTYFPRAGNEELYHNSKKRCEEIRLFWDALAAQLKTFCQEHGFKEEFSPEERIKELLPAWE